MLDNITSGFFGVISKIPGLEKIKELKEKWDKEKDDIFNSDIQSPDKVAPGNPSWEKVQKINADWGEVEQSQWVKATYPWVDSYRAPINKVFSNTLILQFSDMSKWFTHWTNRYTLVKSFQYRIGRKKNIGRNCKSSGDVHYGRSQRFWKR